MLTPDPAPSSNAPRRRRRALPVALGLAVLVLGYRFVTDSPAEVRPTPESTVFSQRVASEPSEAQRPAAEADENEVHFIPAVTPEQAPAPRAVTPGAPVEDDISGLAPDEVTRVHDQAIGFIRSHL